MQKVEIWGAVKVDNQVYRDNEILQLIGKPIAHWKFADDLPSGERNIYVGFEKRNEIFLVQTSMPYPMRWTMPGSALE
jgi:hypothetical protein